MIPNHTTQLLDREAGQLSEALSQLSPANLRLIASLVRQMGGGGGNGSVNPHGFARPADGIPQWVAKMKSERYSPSTISMYRRFVEWHLKFDPNPTKLGLQSHFAKRLDDGLSPAAVENERKALKSLFSFLHQENLWPVDPTAAIKHIKVSYGNRPCPTPEDVEKVMNVGCHRTRDTDKLKTIMTLLATTGLRLTEAASLRKESIDFDALELRILGKGEKHRVVPLLPLTAEALKAYIERRPSGSPFVFPGNGKLGYAEIYNIEKTLRRACLRAGVVPFTPHGLRHFYATEMLRNGAKLEVVGRILGHSSIGITADIYRHVRTGEMHEEHLRFAPLNCTPMRQ
jgi:integrase/recombinase XerC